jgi:uncharacterized MAPEG superfamily protein
LKAALMTTETILLLCAVVLGLVQCLATGVGVSASLGYDYSASPRDDQKPLSGVPGRVKRAYANFMETFPYFAALVLLGAVLHRHSLLTVLGAHLYFWGRLVYWPLYVAGTPKVRSLVWVVSILGIVLLLIGVA